MPRTPEQRKESIAARALDAFAKQPSLRPESLLDAYVIDKDDARIIIDEFWVPALGWQNLITCIEVQPYA